MTKEEVFYSDIFNLQVSWCVQSTYQFSVEWKNQFSLRIHILDYLCQSHFNCLKTDTVGPWLQMSKHCTTFIFQAISTNGK